MLRELASPAGIIEILSSVRDLMFLTLKLWAFPEMSLISIASAFSEVIKPTKDLLSFVNKDEKEKNIINTIVLDAGHGGKDPGACIKSCTIQEKDITLAITKKLGRILERQYNMNVIYTVSYTHLTLPTSDLV